MQNTELEQETTNNDDEDIIILEEVSANVDPTTSLKAIDTRLIETRPISLF